jgi:hypothetical protein
MVGRLIAAGKELEANGKITGVPDRRRFGG